MVAFLLRLSKALGPGLIQEMRRVRLPSGKVIWRKQWVRPETMPQRSTQSEFDFDAPVEPASRQITAEEHRKWDQKLLDGEVSAKDYAAAVGLSQALGDDDDGLFHRIDTDSRHQARKEHPYHRAMDELISAVWNKLERIPSGGSWAQQQERAERKSRYMKTMSLLENARRDYLNPFTAHHIYRELPTFLEAQYGKKWQGIEAGEAARNTYLPIVAKKKSEAVIAEARAKNGLPVEERTESEKPQKAPVQRKQREPRFSLKTLRTKHIRNSKRLSADVASNWGRSNIIEVVNLPSELLKQKKWQTVAFHPGMPQKYFAIPEGGNYFQLPLFEASDSEDAIAKFRELFGG